MTESTTPYNSAILKCLDVEETELTFRHRQPLTMEDFDKAREELEDLLATDDLARTLVQQIVERDRRTTELAWKAFHSREAEAGK